VGWNGFFNGVTDANPCKSFTINDLLFFSLHSGQLKPAMGHKSLTGPDGWFRFCYILLTSFLHPFYMELKLFVMDNVTQPTTAPTNLTTQDVATIREFLPFDWRIQLAGKTGLSVRQVGETFYLRTTNRAYNRKLWGAIIPILDAANRPDLAKKCQVRIDTTNIAHH
jgi:hypothetical protein